MIFIATCVRSAFAQRDDFASLQQQMAQLFEAGRHHEALVDGQRYLEAARARYGEQDVEYARGGLLNYGLAVGRHCDCALRYMAKH
jgi:hypothetical protein